MAMTSCITVIDHNPKISSSYLDATPKEKKIYLVRQKEKEPPPERILLKIPLLKAWMERGITDIV